MLLRCGVGDVAQLHPFEEEGLQLALHLGLLSRCDLGQGLLELLLEDLRLRVVLKLEALHGSDHLRNALQTHRLYLLVQDGDLGKTNEEIDHFVHLIAWHVCNQGAEGFVPLWQGQNVLADQRDVQLDVVEVNFLHPEEDVTEKLFLEFVEALNDQG